MNFLNIITKPFSYLLGNNEKFDRDFASKVKNEIKLESPSPVSYPSYNNFCSGVLICPPNGKFYTGHF